MNLSKMYKDSAGNDCSILGMVQREPEWAANRIQDGENATATIAEKDAEIERLKSNITETVSTMDREFVYVAKERANKAEFELDELKADNERMKSIIKAGMVEEPVGEHWHLAAALAGLVKERDTAQAEITRLKTALSGNHSDSQVEADLLVLADEVLKEHAARNRCYSKNGCSHPTTFNGEGSPCKTCQYVLCDCEKCELARKVKGE